MKIKRLLLSAVFASSLSVAPRVWGETSSADAAQGAATPQAPEPVATGFIEGHVLERGTLRPLPDVNVYILPAKLKATTDESGYFKFPTVEEGDFQFVVNASDYKRFEANTTLDLEKPPRMRTLYLERTNYQVFEITVRDRAKKRDDTTRTMKAEQFLTVPGANGDPVKAVQNLPGVARVQGFSSQVVIQGSAPKDTSYVMDEISVPLIFHFGGLTSVITPEAVDQVEYLSAGYGPEYGSAIGGLVGLKTRNPATDRRKGFLFADTTKAGGLLEGPIDKKSSYLVTGRYSYVGLVLKQVLKDNPKFDLTVAPEFSDVAGIYNRHLTEKDDFRFLTIASHDELKFLFKEPLREQPALRGSFSNETNFYRLIPQWTHRYDDGSIGKMSFGFGQDVVHIDVGTNYFDLRAFDLTYRAELERKFGPAWTSHFGFDSEFDRAKVSLHLPTISTGGGVSNPFSSGDVIEIAITQDDLRLAPYWRNELKIPDSKWTLMPSLRLDTFSVTKEALVQPRAAARYDVNDSLFYRAATGLYYQPPEPQESAKSYGNPDLKSPYAWHFVTGAEKDFRHGSDRGFVLQSSLFYKLFGNLVIESTKFVDRGNGLEAERFNNDGKGRAYGAEFLIKYDAKPWKGWISYTLSRSTREQPGQSETIFQYDQTHNINVVGSLDGKNNWLYSARVRYVTGNPVTPVIGGYFDADNDVYTPQRGPYYSTRLDPFFQVDLRIDKKFIYDTGIVTGYLDIQNLTNQDNAEGVRYAYDYSQSKKVSGLPILPTLGLRGEF